MSIFDKLREHSAWSKQIEERCRPLLPTMTDASFRRIVGTFIDIEAHERRNMRPVFGSFVPRAYETPARIMLLLTEEEIAATRAAIIELMDARYGAKPALPASNASEISRGMQALASEMEYAARMNTDAVEGMHEALIEEEDDEP